MKLTQQAFKDIEAAKAAAAQLLYQVGTANKWSAEQYKEAAADLDDVGSGGWGWLASWASLPWNPTSWAGLDDLAKLEAVQAYWEAVAELGAEFEERGLPGADKFRATANQAARTSGSEIEEYKAGRPEVVVVGGATGTAEDLADVSEQGGDLLARYPWLPLAGLAGVVGLVLLVQRGGRTIVVRR